MSDSENHINIIQLLENGPLNFQGNIEVQNAKGETVLKKEKVALCRCGQSTGKPACDGTHRKAGFEAGTGADLSNLPTSASTDSDKLIVKTMKDGPILVEGCYALASETIDEYVSEKVIALCRCGASANKPFCDGSHKTAGFQGS